MNYLASIKPPGETAFHVVEFDDQGGSVRRYVTIFPVGHEPADSLVLAGVIRAVWAVHEVPLVLHPEAGGAVTVADLPGPTIDEAEALDDVDEMDDEPEPEPERPAALTKPAAQPAANRGGRQQKVTDDQLVAAVREHGPTGTSALCQVLDYGSHGSLHARLTRLVAAGRVEKVGTTWRIPQTIAAARPPASTGSAAVPSKPGTGVDPGPITRKPFDPEAARLRAAGEL